MLSLWKPCAILSTGAAWGGLGGLVGVCSLSSGRGSFSSSNAAVVFWAGWGSVWLTRGAIGPCCFAGDVNRGGIAVGITSWATSSAIVAQIWFAFSAPRIWM